MASFMLWLRKDLPHTTDHLLQSVGNGVFPYLIEALNATPVDEINEIHLKNIGERNIVSKGESLR